jgi:hypothetical protein
MVCKAQYPSEWHFTSKYCSDKCRKEAAKKQFREYYYRNREKMKERSRKYYYDNRERIRARENSNYRKMRNQNGNR